MVSQDPWSGRQPVNLSRSDLVYYSPTSAEYDLMMNKYPFHDSGIADEVLSDDAGSVDGELQQQESPEGNEMKTALAILKCLRCS